MACTVDQEFVLYLGDFQIIRESWHVCTGISNLPRNSHWHHDSGQSVDIRDDALLAGYSRKVFPSLQRL